MVTSNSATLIHMSDSAPLESDASAPDIACYRLVEKIGAGGMGAVYLAVDRITGRRCAVKVNRPNDAADTNSEQRLEFERDVLRRLSHRHIVRLLAQGATDAGASYFAMEYVAGENLDEHVNRHGALAPGRVLRILRQLCGALREVHARELVHGDVKPANVVIAERASRDHVKLIDFGLARPTRGQVGADGDDGSADAFAGSPLYAPPESSTGALDVRSDIYSLGATAYFLLTGRPVFDEDKPLKAIVAHAERAPVSVKSLEPGVSAALDDIVMTCLRKRPEDRFQDVEELDAALSEAAVAEHATARPEARRMRTRRRLPAQVRHATTSETVAPCRLAPRFCRLLLSASACTA
jgi:serine/threonine-protein kinase